MIVFKFLSGFLVIPLVLFIVIIGVLVFPTFCAIEGVYFWELIKEGEKYGK